MALLRIAAVLAAALFFTIGARAEKFPDRPVHIVAPFAAGGGTDILARILAQALSDELGQPFVVDDKPGASGSIGAESVARAQPDGYTLLMGSNAPNATNGAIFKKLPYDVRTAFAPISLVATVPNVLLISPKLKVSNLHELIELARKEPNKLTFGSAGVGSPAHLAAALFMRMAHIELLHVPYTGGSATLPDLISGRLDMMFADMLTAAPQVKGGTLRALAVTTSKRASALPDVPTMAEAGLPGYDTSLWYALFAPAKTPSGIIDALNRSVERALQNPVVRSKIAAQGGTVVASTPAQTKQFVDREITKWAGVARDLHIAK